MFLKFPFLMLQSWDHFLFITIEKMKILNLGGLSRVQTNLTNKSMISFAQSTSNYEFVAYYLHNL